MRITLCVVAVMLLAMSVVRANNGGTLILEGKNASIYFEEAGVLLERSGEGVIDVTTPDGPVNLIIGSGGPPLPFMQSGLVFDVASGLNGYGEPLSPDFGLSASVYRPMHLNFIGTLDNGWSNVTEIEYERTVCQGHNGCRYEYEINFEELSAYPEVASLVNSDTQLNLTISVNAQQTLDYGSRPVEFTDPTSRTFLIQLCEETHLIPMVGLRWLPSKMFVEESYSGGSLPAYTVMLLATEIEQRDFDVTIWRMGSIHDAPGQSLKVGFTADGRMFMDHNSDRLEGEEVYDEFSNVNWWVWRFNTTHQMTRRNKQHDKQRTVDNSFAPSLVNNVVLGGGGFEGSVLDFRVYKIYLSDTQVDDVYAGTESLNPSDLMVQMDGSIEMGGFSTFDVVTKGREPERYWECLEANFYE